MEDKIKKVLSDVLDIEEKIISEESSPETIETWDSLKHMNLVVALEEEFNIEFTDDELVELISYPLIVEIIKEKV